MSQHTQNEKTLKYRKKAVDSHNMNSPVFFDRYTILDEDPYASAFAYGRKKLFEKMDATLDEQLKGQGKVLEVACGTGYYLNRLRSMGYDVTGLEPAQGMRERAMGKNPGVTVHDGIATELPFADDTFDAVVSIELLRYLEAADIKQAYTEMFRVLKPGGLLMVTLVNRYALDGFWFLYNGRLMMEKVFGKEIINYCDFVSPAGMESYINEHFGYATKTESALLAPLRLVYKVSPKLGKAAAKKAEKLDESFNQKDWHKKFAGHLIMTAKKK
jgi:ubiquinone/menaquinone biosynthesis C-methylase UbiE